MARKAAWYVPVGRALVMGIAASVTAGALTIAVSSPVRALAGDLAAIKAASDLDQDPRDAQAVAQVCTVCHSSSQFLSTPRGSTRWEQVFAEMSGFGADGTDDQLDRVVNYFQKNLTVINVNTSSVEDVKETLQVSDQVAAEIMARRNQRLFTGMDDLGKISGVDRSILEKLAAKNCLQF
ncbi:MAG TPA: helix-hairpin-helix domain-containing protein [Rhizomicrobium sp.]|nr:helix-hairpin-helix domain-containing protein [Rhizomicrobium sp.]